MHRLALGLALIGCTSTSHNIEPPVVQMNDLSVMLPLARSQAELDAMVGPTANGTGGVLLPEALFQMDSSAGPIAYASLKLVAFRLDPCFGPTDPAADPSKCQNQLRLIFQPLTFSSVDGKTFADDSAVHVFYSLTRDQLLAAVDEMIAAREADVGEDDLGPLAPHKVIATEGPSGALAHSYQTIITKYAGQANLVRFTSFLFLSLEGGNAPRGSNIVGFEQFWALHGHDAANGVATPMIIPGLPQGTIDQSLDAQADPFASRFSPATTLPDDITVLADASAASAATAAQRQAAFDAALRIVNPHHHTPNTIDCVSCHMAQPAIELVGEPLGLSQHGNANAFVPDAAIHPADLMATTQLIGLDGGLNIHAFSYRGTEPMINQRVINETAANVMFVTKLRH